MTIGVLDTPPPTAPPAPPPYLLTIHWKVRCETLLRYLSRHLCCSPCPRRLRNQVRPPRSFTTNTGPFGCIQSPWIRSFLTSARRAALSTRQHPRSSGSRCS